MSNVPVIVTEEDRDLRQQILNFIVLCLDRPCGSGDTPDDRNNGLDAIIARHRIAATSTLQDQVEAYREALAVADNAITEMFRYYDGGETRGSYDGKPGRAQLRKAGYAVRAALTQKDISG